jgi:hypothetical protein
LTKGLGYVFALGWLVPILLYTDGWRFNMMESMGAAFDHQFGEPQHEAAFFYGLFLRGHPLQKLREDIDVPPQVLERWKRQTRQEPWAQPTLERVLSYRKHVLAIFDSLVFKELAPSERIQ